MEKFPITGFEVCWMLILALGALALLWAVCKRAFTLKDDEASAAVLNDSKTIADSSMTPNIPISRLRRRLTIAAMTIIIGSLVIAPIMTVVLAHQSTVTAAHRSTNKP